MIKVNEYNDKEKIELFKKVFRGRVDCYGYGTGKCRHEPITDAVLLDHLRGRIRIGMYPLSPDILSGGGVYWTAADIDAHGDKGLEKFNRSRGSSLTWQEAAEKVLNALRTIGIKAYTEVSKSGSGCHIFIFFVEPIEAKKAVSIMRYACTIAERDTGFYIAEVFPKQLSLDDVKYGSYVNLPLNGKENIEAGRTVFVDPDNGFKPFPNQWMVLEDILKNLVLPNTVDGLIESGEVELIKEIPMVDRQDEDTKERDYAAILRGKLDPDKGRTENLVTLAGHWHRTGVPVDEAVELAIAWDIRNKLRLDDDQKYQNQYPGLGKIRGTVQDIYKRYSEDEISPGGLAISAMELLSLNLPDPQMIIGKGILPVGGYTMMAAETKTGKTTLAVQMCISIVSGTPFLGCFRIEKRARVLYVHVENTKQDMAKLIRQQVENWGQPIEIGDAIHTLEADRLCLQEKKGIDWLRKNIEETKTELVVIDPVALAMAQDINKLEHITNFIRKVLAKISQEYGVSWLLIHHYGKPGMMKRSAIQSMIGSSGWGNYCQSFMGLERWSERRSPAYLRITFEKRHDIPLNDMCLFRNPQTRLFEVVENPEQIPAIKTEMVRDILIKHGEPAAFSLLVSLVEGSLGISEAHAIKLIGDAKKDGIIMREEGKFGKYYLDEFKNNEENNTNS